MNLNQIIRYNLYNYFVNESLDFFGTLLISAKDKFVDVKF